jgi:hypothetical protein
MTADAFRRMALSFPEAIEVGHMGHPDFRVGGKIFATLGYPDNDHGVVILSPEEQAKVLAAKPDAFTPAKGAWGARGATQVRLDAVDLTTLRNAMAQAFRKRAPKRAMKRLPNK